MGIYKGNGNNPSAIYVGNSSIGKVYLGMDLVWQKINLANSKLGLLYNWPAATDIRGIAPLGWHLPTQNELLNLITELGGESGSGGKLKENDSTYWLTPNTGATNEAGFYGRGGGWRQINGNYAYIKSVLRIWSSDIEFSELELIWIGLSYDSANFQKYYIQSAYFSRVTGMNIRLIKDDSNDEGTMTDNDGFVYPTVKIGTQVWMAANLKTTKYRNGDTIPEVTGNSEWVALTTGALCAYDNDWDNV